MDDKPNEGVEPEETEDDEPQDDMADDGFDDDIYRDHIMDHYEDPYHRGRCPHLTHANEGDNPLCGDNVHIELRVNDRHEVEEAWFDGEGCCISQASASMLIEEIEGKTVEQVKQFSANDMLKLFGAKLTPNRQKCCLLSWRVVQGAIFSPAGDDKKTGGDGPG
ncbi:MAG: iron-sulfur cluster assembly scaffold protein [Pirellulales bacterium]